MNNALRSAIKPGIYNANMAVYKNGSNLYLSIKKGTTFVFSNEYTGRGGSIRRNFGSVEKSKYSPAGTGNLVSLIKSVALYDMTIFLSASTLEDCAVFAFINYDPKNTGTQTLTSPSFFVVGIDNDTSSNYLYKGNGVIMYSTNDGSNNLTINGRLLLDGELSENETIPESKTDDGGMLIHQYLLNLGFLKVNGSNVISFTGRGLPEYRNSITADKNILYPDFIPCFYGENALKDFAVDIPQGFIGTTVFESVIPSSSNNNESCNSWESTFFSKRKGEGKVFPISLSRTGIEAVYAKVSNIRSYSRDTASSATDELEVSYGKVSLGDTITLESIDNSIFTLESEVSSFAVLDVSPYNVHRLLSSIKGMDIWSEVIDNIRQDSDNNNPNEITDIIPIALSFGTGSLDTANILCYFGLENQMSRINTFNVREHNIYNVIPVMD